MAVNNLNIKINSRLCFRPLLDILKKNITEGNAGQKKLYSHLIEEIEKHPQLLKPIDDPASLKPHIELIQQILATIFPPTTSGHENLHAVALPFTFHTVYTPAYFNSFF